MNQRWYDKDPTLSLAISLIKNSDEKIRHLCAKKIIEIAKDNNVEVKSGFFNIMATFHRWYDEDNELLLAMEYLKESQTNLRKTIAVEIIQLLQLSEVE